MAYLNDLKEYSFTMTSFVGNEDEILNLRNKNRTIKKDRSYLQWRYLGLKTKKAPEIFWIKNKNGTEIGMASIIYRPYWINNKLLDLMVLGDISLNKQYRGTGLAKIFFNYLSKQLLERKNCFALVLPNIVAKKVLKGANWQEREELNNYVLLLNPYNKIKEKIKYNIISFMLAKIWKGYVNLLFWIINDQDYTIAIKSEFDNKFDVLWEKFNKKGLCIGDKGLTYLQWRYKNKNILIAQCFLKNEMVAYLIYKIIDISKDCIIYDLISYKKSKVLPFLKLFIQYVNYNEEIESIRMKMNSSHMYAKELKKIGFFSRKEGDVFQLLMSKNIKNEEKKISWMITEADKDI